MSIGGNRHRPVATRVIFGNFSCIRLKHNARENLWSRQMNQFNPDPQSHFVRAFCPLQPKPGRSCGVFLPNGIEVYEYSHPRNWFWSYSELYDQRVEDTSQRYLRYSGLWGTQPVRVKVHTVGTTISILKTIKIMYKIGWVFKKERNGQGLKRWESRGGPS